MAAKYPAINLSKSIIIVENSQVSVFFGPEIVEKVLHSRNFSLRGITRN